MNFKPSQTLHSFLKYKLPNERSHPADRIGFSVYRGVLLEWDYSRDERLSTLIDTFPDSILNQLFIALEHKGTLQFMWKTRVPYGYEEGVGFDVEGDHWPITDSITLLDRVSLLNLE